MSTKSFARRSVFALCSIMATASCSDGTPLTPSVHEQQPANAVDGSAYVRPWGFAPATCAGQIARLVPATGQIKNAVFREYGSLEHGFRRTKDDLTSIFRPRSPEWTEIQDADGHSTTCERDGSFHFYNVLPGEYYVFADVRWHSGHAYTGGSLCQHISVNDAGVTKVTLSETVPFRSFYSNSAVQRPAHA